MQLLSDWQDDLSGCPSQCYAEAKHEEKKFVLYLRWRHEDPWQGHVIENVPVNPLYLVYKGEWSPDLFQKYDYFFEEDNDLSKVKSALIMCAERWFKER